MPIDPIFLGANNMRSFLLGGSVAIGFMIGIVSPVQSDPPSTTDLLQRMPQATNAVVVVQVGNILQSPYAFRSGWNKQTKTFYIAGSIPINPAIVRLAIGSQFDPEHPGQSWYVGLMSMNKTLSLEKIAEAHKRKIVEIAGEKVALVPPYGYVASLKDDLLCAVTMSDHQAFAHWLKFATAQDRKPVVNSYLASAASRHAEDQILIAIDGDDLIDPANVRTALLNSKVIVNDEKLFDRASRFLEKLRGIRLVVTLDSQISIAAHFDSQEVATRDLEILKPFFVYALDHAGADLQDLQAAKVTADGKTLSLRFKLSDAELRGIMALMSSPIVHPNPDEVSNVPVNSGGVSAEVTGNYFRTVNKILDDLKKRTRNATDYWNTALWHETAIKNIGTTSVLNVDKRVLAYAAEAVATLQSIADSLRGVPVSLDQLEARKSLYVMGSPWFRWGGYSVSTNIPQVQAKQVEVIQKDAENRDKLWQRLDTQRANVRREMAEKYGVDMERAPK